MNTSDRLSESERRLPHLSTLKAPSKERRSVFKELGLDDEDIERIVAPEPKPASQEQGPRKLQSRKSSYRSSQSPAEEKDRPWYSKVGFGRGQRPQIKSSTSAPPGSFATMPRVAMIAFLLAVVVPAFTSIGNNVPAEADAGTIFRAEMVENGSLIKGRDDTPTDVCTRWSHQSMLRKGRWTGHNMLM
jgi:hypothetical protein